MRPNDQIPSGPTPQLVIPERDQFRGAPLQNQHVADIARGQIASIYTSTSSSDDTLVATSQHVDTNGRNVQYSHQDASIDSPYGRTHDDTHLSSTPSAWERYHSAWQNYYQQYYERYYINQVHDAKRQIQHEVAQREPIANPTLSSDEAMYDMRSKLRSQLQQHATAVRKSRHFIPVIAALTVTLVFLIIQFNRVGIAWAEAFISPGSLDSQNIVVDPSITTAVSSEPRLVIPKIAVDVPIIWDADASSQASLNEAMNHGVVWFNIQGASARPGELGNFVLSGHSSNDLFDNGSYKFIFVRLEQMKVGDTIYANYEGTRYTYTITDTKVVKPTDVGSLRIGTDKPRITLITCTPIGTDLNRLLVFADQISPDPSGAKNSEPTAEATNTVMPSSAPTFFERIFGIKK